jgi:ribosomal protein S18 acetylase RimI-like enzyme
MPGSALPSVNDALVRRLDTVSTAFARDWLEGVAALPGNPRGLRLATFGGAFAAAATGAPELDFMNRVHHLWPEDAHLLPSILDLYSGTGIRPWFEVFPSEDGVDGVGGAIARAGAAPVSFITFLYGAADAPPAAASPATGIQIRTVTAGDVDLFSDVLLRGHGVPEEEHALARDGQRHWVDLPGTTLYLATVDDTPAAAAVLRIGDGIGYLANAATLPDFRGRGCQTALLARRIADASAAGCELSAGQAIYGSASQRNMERIGLRPAVTVTTWRMITSIGV